MLPAVCPGVCSTRISSPAPKRTRSPSCSWTSAAAMPQPSHTDADVKFMQGMIHHHAQALDAGHAQPAVDHRQRIVAPAQAETDGVEVAPAREVEQHVERRGHARFVGGRVRVGRAGRADLALLQLEPERGREVAVVLRLGGRLDLRDERLGREQDFSAKRGVVHSEVILPENAPQAWSDRERLWNAVEASEVRKDAQLAREVEFAIPREMSVRDGIELADRKSVV